MNKKVLAVMGMTMSLCLTSCGILPTEEEFDAAPMVKEYEGADYSKITVTRGDLVKTEEITGKYKGTVEEEILSDGISVVQKIYVKKGQKVEVGDKVMHYLIQSGENALEEATNKIEKLELEIRQAKRMMELEISKVKKTGGNGGDISNIRNQYNQQITSCQSSLRLAQMDAKLAKEEIAEGEVTASVDGVIKMVDRKAIGNFGVEDEPIIKIQGKKKNRFEASSKYASYVKDGETVTINIKGQDYKATVKKDKDDDESVYFYPKTKMDLEAGTLCSYEVVLKEKKNILYLPSSVVYSMGDKNVVYYEDENGLKTTKEVTLGESIENFVEITGGLEENEQIIIN